MHSNKYLNSHLYVFWTSGSQSGQYSPPSREPNQVSKGPQENDGKLGDHNSFWVGPTKLHCRNKIFQIWHPIKSSLLPCILHSAEGEAVFYCFFATSYLVQPGFSWVTYLLSNVDYRPGEEWQYSLITDHTATEHSKACMRSSDPRNTLNTMPIIIRIFLLLLVNNVLYPNKIFKNEIIL